MKVDFLEALRNDRLREIEWAQLGERLQALGVTEQKARDFLSALSDSRRRPHRDDAGEWHPGLRVDIDDEDPRRSTDFEVVACWHDDELRFDRHLDAHKSSTNLPSRLSESSRIPASIKPHDPRNDDPEYLDELRVAAHLPAIHVFLDGLEETEAEADRLLV